ncbi:MAG: putative universal stress protein [Pelotomaculum sp. PtaU1.Bin035]|nr:MAG: putative universal stress protein [Pelotomaculum sp. PtaU1.Bin035]
MYRKILVPFDNSSQSLSAVQHALKLAKVSKATVTLFHVVQDIPLFLEERVKVRIGADRAMLFNELRIKAQAMLDQLKESLAGNDIKIDTAVAIGSPSREILKKTKIEGYDVIIMGSRGLGKIPGLIMGSVSNKVCSNASCPVIVIHIG